MLIQLLIQQPQAIGPLLRATPSWVWFLLAALIALGLSQLRDRQASRVRVTVFPAAMAAFSLWGAASVFGRSGSLGLVLAVWLLAAAAVATLASRGRADARYDAATRRFHMPGSAVPLMVIIGIFAVRWGVNVELALAPAQALDAGFALTVAALYGGLCGLLSGRSLRLWRLALGRPGAGGPGTALPC